MADIPFSEVANLPHRAPDQTMVYGTSPLQSAEYWRAQPPGPLVVLIHGGCWLNAYDRTHIRPLATAIAERDVAVLSIEYRRIGDPGGGWPGTFEDVTAALKKASSLGHSDIIIAGHSAGGHLALWLASQRLSDGEGQGAKGPVNIKGVIGLAAISDLNRYATGSSGCEKATIQLMGGTPTELADRYKSASPLSLEPQVPTLLIHGDQDRIVNITQSEGYVKAHPKTLLRVLPDHGHFDLVDPRQTTPDLIVEQIQQWIN